MKRPIQSEDVPSSPSPCNTEEAFDSLSMLIHRINSRDIGYITEAALKMACEAGHPGALYLRDHVSRLESPEQILEELRAIEEPNEWCYYLQGCLVPNAAESVRLWQLSNNSYAHYLLGIFYRNETERSIYHHSIAADAGLLPAHISRVVAARFDPERHFDFSYKACHAGVYQAYTYLSECYNTAYGTKADLYQAIYWGSFNVPKKTAMHPIVSLTLSAVYKEYRAGDTRRMYPFFKAISEKSPIWNNATMQMLGSRVRGAIIRAKRATLCWMWMQKVCGLNRFFPRDIALRIGHLIWEGRKNEFYVQTSKRK